MKKATDFVWAFALVELDQLTKLLVKGVDVFGIQHQGMELGESRPLIGDVVRLTFVENPGMAFGISFGAGKILLTLATIGIVAFLAWYLASIRHTSAAVRMAVGLVFAGAVGNLIDRLLYGVFYGYAPLFYGKVVDFIQVDIPDITWFGDVYTHWPVFNIADSCVSVGVVMLIFMSNAMPTIQELRQTNKVERGDL